MDKGTFTILVVDDDIGMRLLLAEYLNDVDNYSVIEACNGSEALAYLGHEQVDLILSDINMPGIKGFDLLHRVRELFPAVKRILMTSYNVEGYLELALKYDIGSIFAKTTPFNFDELSSILSSLLSNDIFGANRFFSAPAESMEISIRSPKHLEQQAGRLMSFIGDSSATKKIELVLVELLTNAIFYGIRHESPEDKLGWNHNFTLAAKDAVIVSVLKDNEKYAVTINDHGGNLKKRDVLYWLHRQIAQDTDGLPLGLYDSHGRGFFITRKYIDRLIINIDRSRRTEIIIINYFSNEFVGYKPLYINEL